MQRGGMARALLLPCLALVACALAGCTLIDQRTFNPQAGRKPPDLAGPAGPAPAPPLVTVDFGRPNPDYAAELHQAVVSAVSRKPDVQFDVVTVVPAAGAPADQVGAATGLTADARAVARAISADGVDDDRIHLLARAEAVATRQVQVFVR